MSDFEDKDSNTSIDTGWVNPPKLSDLKVTILMAYWNMMSTS